MSAVHKPRKKTKKDNANEGSSASQDSAVVSEGSLQKPAFPLASFLWPARKGTSQWVILPLTLMVAGLFRWAIGLWGYSGFQTPPMHGDFEAQRHWMEITTHLPVAKWYFYDLEYWGLDYPPLTAYHSWLLGILGSLFSPLWFDLDASRGIEMPNLKVFMRASVLVSEYLAYAPALIILNRKLARLGGLNVWESSIALTAVLMQPATMLIDHAHFQYNTVMLGFTLASISSMLAGRFFWSCIFFVASLGFKQMALYYAPAVFAYLLGVCIQPKVNIARFLGIAVTTLASFAVLFLPLLLGAYYNHYRDPSLNTVLQPPDLLLFIKSHAPLPVDEQSLFYPILLHLTQAVHRTFPLARGLFEDKVANVWCALHTVYKLNRFSVSTLSRVSLLATLLAITPSCVIIAAAPRKNLIPYAFASCAWGFFLCSFQVHEKSVLLPLLPMTILLGGEAGLSSEIRAWVGWANTLGTWTIFPLLQRDQLRMPYAVLCLLWAYLLGIPPASLSLYSTGKKGLPLSTKALHLGFYTIMLLWHLVEAFVPMPVGKPDLCVVFNCIVGAAGFGICYLWCTYQLLTKSGLLSLFERPHTQQAEKPSASKANHEKSETKSKRKAR